MCNEGGDIYVKGNYINIIILIIKKCITREVIYMLKKIILTVLFV